MSPVPPAPASDWARGQKSALDSNPAHWDLRLYVAGQSPRSVAAFANLRRLCEEHLAGRYRIEVIDLLENPTLAAGDQIVALPTLVRKLPEPVQKIIGDLSNTERTLVGLQRFVGDLSDHQRVRARLGIDATRSIAAGPGLP